MFEEPPPLLKRWGVPQRCAFLQSLMNYCKVRPIIFVISLFKVFSKYINQVAFFFVWSLKTIVESLMFFSSSKFSKCFCIACLFRFTEETFLIRLNFRCKFFFMQYHFRIKRTWRGKTKFKIWKYFLFILFFPLFTFPLSYCLPFFGTGRV